jgi:hypothetical protein
MGKDTISSKVRNKIRVSILSTLIQHSFGIPNQSNKIGRRNKRNSNRKGEIKLSLFTEDMTFYLKDPTNTTKNIPRHQKHIQQRSRIQNLYTKKSVAFPIYPQCTD